MEAVTADYTVWIHASDSPKAGTDGRVAIELHGQGGSSSQQWLHNQQKTPFSRGKVTAPAPGHVSIDDAMQAAACNDVLPFAPLLH